MHDENTFFTKLVYNTEIRLDVNADVLNRIYSSKVSPNDKLPIEFFYVSDSIEKLKKLGVFLMINYPDYHSIKAKPYNNLFELSGVTEPMGMQIEIINAWNRLMWDAGYQFDCKLDGWQVGT
jgi:hypothetical protein